MRWVVGVALGVVQLAGCASHSALTKAAREALDKGKPQEAIAELNDKLKVEKAEDVPEKVDGDIPLLLLDRATVLQQVGEYKLSSRDLQIADKQVQLLDFSRTKLDDIGRYMFSDDVGPYRAPAPTKS